VSLVHSELFIGQKNWPHSILAKESAGSLRKVKKEIISRCWVVFFKPKGQKMAILFLLTFFETAHYASVTHPQHEIGAPLKRNALEKTVGHVSSSDNFEICQLRQWFEIYHFPDTLRNSRQLVQANTTAAKTRGGMKEGKKPHRRQWLFTHGRRRAYSGCSLVYIVGRKKGLFWSEHVCVWMAPVFVQTNIDTTSASACQTAEIGSIFFAFPDPKP
jgi:hypothetical protein